MDSTRVPRALPGNQTHSDQRGALVYQDVLNLHWGQLIVTDANSENALVVGVEPGRREIRIHVDESPTPRKVEIPIDEP